MLSQGQASPASTAFNLMNTVVGAGILALPFCFKEIGAILTLVLLPLLGIVAMCTMYLLSIVSEMTKKMAAESVGEFLFGKAGRIVTELSIMGASFGGLTAYLVVMGDILCPFMKEITHDPFLSSRFFVTLVPFVLFVVPLTLVKDFRALRFSSAASIACVIVFMGVIVHEFVHRAAQDGIRHSVIENRFTWSGFIMALPVFSFSFSAHISVFPLYSELRDKSPSKMAKVIITGVSLCVAMYCIIGFCGFALFEDDTKGDFLVNLADLNGIHFRVIRLLFAFTMVATFPVMFQPFRIAIDKMMFHEKPFSRKRQIIESLCIDVMTFILAVFVPHITLVLGLTGATAMGSIGYIIPGFFYLRTSGIFKKFRIHANDVDEKDEDKDEEKDKIASEEDITLLSAADTFSHQPSRSWSWFSISVIIGGSVVGVAGTIVILVHVVQGDIHE